MVAPPCGLRARGLLHVPHAGVGARISRRRSGCLLRPHAWLVSFRGDRERLGDPRSQAFAGASTGWLPKAGARAMEITLEAGAEPVPGYRLVERLGRGGCGEVWKATGPGGFELALKFVCLTEPVGPLELRALQIIKDLRHPHLLSTFGAWQVQKYLVISMELAERTLLVFLLKKLDLNSRCVFCKP